jgi:hypothetical protein
MFATQHVITSISGSTVNITPPLYRTLSTADIFPWSAGVLVERAGIENLTVDGVDSAKPMMTLYKTRSCWVKNVEFANCWRGIVDNMASIFGEVREVKVNGIVSSGPGTEGIFLNYCTGFLIENNNLYDAGFPAICLGNPYGANSGNVIGYNWVVAANTGDANTVGTGIGINHGGHNAFNLIEGNVTEQMMSDGYYASSSQNTFLRNWTFLRLSAETTNIWGFNLARGANYENVVGNVIGDQTGFDLYTMGTIWTGFYWYIGGASANSPPTSSPSFAATTPPNYRTWDDTILRDLNPAATMLFHGNWLPNATDQLPFTVLAGQQWDPAVADHAIPDSYYTTKADLIARGVVWGSLPYPPVDPASPPSAFSTATAAALLPAAYRYLNDDDPPTSGAPSYNVGRLRFMRR